MPLNDSSRWVLVCATIGLVVALAIIAVVAIGHPTTPTILQPCGGAMSPEGSCGPVRTP